MLSIVCLIVWYCVHLCGVRLIYCHFTTQVYTANCSCSLFMLHKKKQCIPVVQFLILHLEECKQKTLVYSLGRSYGWHLSILNSTLGKHFPSTLVKAPSIIDVNAESVSPLETCICRHKTSGHPYGARSLQRCGNNSLISRVLFNPFHFPVIGQQPGAGWVMEQY